MKFKVRLPEQEIIIEAMSERKAVEEANKEFIYLLRSKGEDLLLSREAVTQ